MSRMRLTPGKLARSQAAGKRASEDIPVQYQPEKVLKGHHTPHPDFKERKRPEKKSDEPPPPAPPVSRGITFKEDPNQFKKMDLNALVALASARVEHGMDRSTITLPKRILAVLPTPHAKQIEIESSPAKRKVVNMGRRVGKTTGSARIGVIKMSEGRRVLFASPSQDQVDAFWDYCKVWLDSFIQSGEIIKNESRRILEMPSTGGRLRAKTASNADALRGDFADFMVLDECAMLEKKAWDEVGAPMLLDNDGDAWFLSTPKRRNWFYNLYMQARADTTGRWAYFHATSYDNPYLSEEGLAEIRKDLSEDLFQQEVMAQFLEGDGAVFRNIDSCLTAPTKPDVPYHKAHFKVIGADWGQSNDFSVFSCFCATCMQELELLRFNRVEWKVARERLITLTKKWGVAVILAEENSMSVLIEALTREDHLPVQPFNTGPTTKGPLIRALALCFERNDATWLPDEQGRLELEAYESVTSSITMHTSFSAPKGMHDDIVIARALALRAAIEKNTVGAPRAMSYADMNVMSYDEMEAGGIGSQGSNIYAPGLPQAISYSQPHLDLYIPNRGQEP